MIVRYTQDSLHDLNSIHSYISEDSPDAAASTVGRIVAGIDGLGRNPRLGRVGRVHGTRELVIAPYVIVYTIYESTVEINAVIHSARQWPTSF